MPGEQEVQHQPAVRRCCRGDGVERVPNGRPGEVVRRPQPREERRRLWVEPGTVQRFVQPIGLEIDRHERQMGGEPAVHPAHPLLLECLHARLIHLEDPDALHELRMPQSVAVQPGAEDYVLPDAGRDRLLESILGIARTQDVLGVDRVERPEQLVDDDPVEQAVVGDLPPERRHQPHGVGVVQDRVGMPPAVVRPNAGRQRRRTADASSSRSTGSTRRHAAEHTGAGALTCCSVFAPENSNSAALLLSLPAATGQAPDTMGGP